MDRIATQADRLFEAVQNKDAAGASATLEAINYGEISQFDRARLEGLFVSLFVGSPDFALLLPRSHSDPALGDMLGQLRMESLFRVGGGVLDARAREEVESVLSGCGGYFRELYSGALHMVDGEKDEAYQAFIRANAYGEHPRMFQGCAAVRPYGEPWSGGDHEKFGQVTFRQGEPNGPSIVFSGDEKYFLNFAEHLVKSFDATGSVLSVHFHVIGWSPACEALAARLDASVSSEPLNVPGDRTWFATARFYRLPTFLEWFGKVVLTDMDVSIVRRPETLFTADVGVRYVQSLERFPWWPVTGGCTSVCPTPAGMQFAASLRDYIATRFVPGKSAWWFDQLALYDVVDSMRERMTLTDPQKVAGVIKIRPITEIGKLKR